MRVVGCKISNSCVANKSNNLCTSLQTKGCSDCLYLPSFPSLPVLSPSLFLSVHLLFLQRTHSLKLISHGALLIVWSQSRHAGTMATGGVYTASVCKFATFDDTRRMKGLNLCVCVCVCTCVHWIHLTCTCHGCQKQSYLCCHAVWAVLYPKMRNHNRYRTLTCQFIRIPSNGVSGLPMNGGFMRSVCLRSSISSTKPP